MGSAEAGKKHLLPKPVAGKLPLLITGGSQQDSQWLAQNGDGWMLYPRPAPLQTEVINDWRKRMQAIRGVNQPVMEPLYVDLADDPDTLPHAIHLGFRLGMNRLCDYLKTRQEIGVNHVALNLRFNQADIEATMRRLADELLAEFQK